MKIRAKSRSRARALILAGCGVLLAWLVVSRSLVAYLADVAPQAALWLSPRQPEALTNLADRSLNSMPAPSAPLGSIADQTPNRSNNAASDHAGDAAPVADQSPQQKNDLPGARDLADTFAIFGQNRNVDLAQLRAEVISGLRKEPLNARAIRILGQIADLNNDSASAVKFMAAATRLSLHDTIAVYALMRKSADAGDYRAAIAYADALLRTSPSSAYYAVPVLAHFAEDKEALASVEAVLDANPPWRHIFFAILPQSVTDARTPLTLLLALKNSPTPPSNEDIGHYLGLLIGHRFYDLAYYTWLQFLPLDRLRTVGLLFNGSFEFPPSGMPFDWSIQQGSGVTIDIVPRPDTSERHALSVEFLYGRVDYHSVAELVVLPPGAYQFTGEYSGKIVGPRGLKWRVTCADGSRARIGESAMITGVASGWKKTDLTFTVPPADCRAQYVQLDLDARMASEQLVSGTMLFDDLSITRVSAPPGSTVLQASPGPPAPPAAPGPPPAPVAPNRPRTAK